MSDKYYSIQSKSEGLLKDRGSKFIAFLFPCTSDNEFNMELAIIKKMHPKSRHFCYAYRLLDIDRMNDDGEPSGTAGKPILGQLTKFELKNVGAVVVRYFGGTLLGTGGLIQAYKGATAEAIAQNNIIEFKILEDISMEFEYSLLSDVMNCIKKRKLIIKHQDLGIKAKIILSAPPSEILDIILIIKSDVGHIYLEEVTEHTIVPGLKIKTKL